MSTRARADGGVEPLGEAAAGRALEAARHLAQASRGRGDLPRLRFSPDRTLGVLRRAVRIEEGAATGRRSSRPRQRMTMRGLSRDDCNAVAPRRFSLCAAAMNFSSSSGATTTAMRSCDSEIASSVPSRPSYFLRTASRSMSRPSASSPMATDTPPAPKSLQRLIEARHLAVAEEALELALFGRVALLHLCSPAWSRDFSRVLLEEPVAPPHAVAARAAAEQDNDVARCGTLAHGRSSAGAAATTAPHLHAFGNVALVVELSDMARGKADLVAVGGIARRRGLRELVRWGSLPGSVSASGLSAGRRAPVTRIA